MGSLSSLQHRQHKKSWIKPQGGQSCTSPPLLRHIHGRCWAALGMINLPTHHWVRGRPSNKYLCPLPFGNAPIGARGTQSVLYRTYGIRIPGTTGRAIFGIFLWIRAATRYRTGDMSIQSLPGHHSTIPSCDQLQVN